MIGVPNYTREGEKSYPEITGMVELLESRGFKADHRRDKGNIHFEEYWYTHEKQISGYIEIPTDI